MRRKKDDKRVLRPGNGRQTNSRRNKRNNRQFVSRGRNNNAYPRNPHNRKEKKKTNGKLVFLMIIALVAFVIGAGIGVSLSFDDGVNDGPHYVNVTNEMTSDLNDTEDVYYDKNADGIDFNQNQTSQFDVQSQYNYQ